MMEQLEAVGYVSGSMPAAANTGITIHKPDRSHTGFNFYTSGHAPAAILMDMDGNVLHQWTYDFWEVWPDFPVSKSYEDTQFWRRAYLHDNGDILAIFEGFGIFKIDKDSKLIWENPCRAHHDLEVMPDGDIYVLTREAKLRPRLYKTKPILEDYVSILSPDGEEKRRISLLDAFEESPYKDLWRARRRNSRDIFHTNTLEVLDGRHAERMPAFKKGNILISALTTSIIAILDPDTQKIVWAHTGEFRYQHDPHLLENGNILFFDNRGLGKISAVLEFNPVTKKEVWRYIGTEEAPFFSRTCGTAQRLPNGNTLISETDNGRAFEITPRKEIVWEFVNPNCAATNPEFVGSLFEVLRLPPDFKIDWAEKKPQ